MAQMSSVDMQAPPWTELGTAQPPFFCLLFFEGTYLSILKMTNTPYYIPLFVRLSQSYGSLYFYRDWSSFVFLQP